MVISQSRKSTQKGVDSKTPSIEEQMKTDHIMEGMLLEVILFEGAKYDSGETRGNWGEYGGRREFDIPFRGEVTQKPGQKVVGSVAGIHEHGLTFDVLGNLYIPCCVIHSYKILDYKK